ncbi:MAG: hypothetical protein ACRC13_05575 [Tannerellaceae bacterium]
MSCSRSTTITPQLQQAEALMQSAPDSALAILQGISEPEKMSSLNYNTWNLLITQAENKNRVKATTDERIKMARAYFDRTDNKLRKAQCNFYAGQVALDLNKPDSAAVGYLRAIDLLEGTDEYELRGLAYHYWGVLNISFKDANKAKCAFQQALIQFDTNENKKYKVYALRDLARAYYNLELPDSAYVYYNLAVEESKQINDSLLISSIYNSLASYHKAIGSYDSSMHYVRTSIRYNTNPVFIDANYLIIGRLFMQMNQLDSARIYLEQAQASPNLDTNTGAIGELANYYQLLNDPKNESIHLRKYISSRVKQMDLYQQSKIKEIEALYDNERLQRAKLQVEKDHMRLFTIACLLILLFLCVFVLLAVVLHKRKEKLQQLEVQLKERDERITQNEVKIKEIVEHLSSIKTSQENQLSETEHSSIKLLQAERDRLYAENHVLLQKSEEDLKRYKALRKSNKKLSERLIETTDLHTMISDFKGDSRTLDLIRVELAKELKQLYPDFAKKLNKLAPKLDEKDRLICYMLKLNFSNADIAKLLFIQPQTVSQYKSTIVKERFKQEGTTLEDLLYSV